MSGSSNSNSVERLKATGRKAKTLRELRDLITSVSAESILHHTYQYFLKGHVLGMVLTPQVNAAPDVDEVIVGIRPEDITVGKGTAAAGFSATVSVIEPVGSIVWVDARWKHSTIRAMTRPEQEIGAGSEVSFLFAQDRILLFDAASKRRL